MLEWLKDLGVIGFWFFFLKGMAWLVLFFLLYAGVIDKSRFEKIKERMRFFKRKKAG